MAGRQCHHCKQWIEAGEAHDCWTTTESALTADLEDDLRDARERLRETAASLGRHFLEVCIFLGRTVKAPQVRRTDPVSRVKVAHILQIRHRDEVEAPITDWLREAYESSDELSAKTPAAKEPPC